MKHFKREDNEVLALDAMQEKANELEIKGVACILIVQGNELTWRPVLRRMGRIERDPDTSKDPKDSGANYLAIVCSKIAEMVSTGQNSGSKIRPGLRGELEVRGGITRRDSREALGRTINYRLFTAFSGGLEDEDVVIATAGMDALFD